MDNVKTGFGGSHPPGPINAQAEDNIMSVRTARRLIHGYAFIEDPHVLKKPLRPGSGTFLTSLPLEAVADQHGTGPHLCKLLNAIFPPKPVFTERNVADLKGKVFIVTGSNAGIGKELARILFAKNARVYIAARSEEKSQKAIADIQKAVPDSTGELIFLQLDLADLESVKYAARSFLAKEQKLNILFNNAGVMVSPEVPPPKSKQGYELSIGVNCVGTLLFTKLLTPTLAATVKSEPANSVRVIWLSSFGLEIFGEGDVGLSTDNLGFHIPAGHTERYGRSKVGAWALAVEYAKRHRADGIVSVPLNPGNIQTELARDQSFIFRLLVRLITYPPVNGAYTELFAGFAPEITIDAPRWSEKWVVPFGRIYPLRSDLGMATKSQAEGSTGGTAKFWEWCEQQIKDYL
ncbi:putative short-chain dehydrogenase [Seiridium unicorne]|uniref:Short-chain dehydrogenase n=1 Tax=Seiridium unicorne TaxID=138068 RepID=A0ABR2VD19_9PEZI